MKTVLLQRMSLMNGYARRGLMSLGRIKKQDDPSGSVVEEATYERLGLEALKSPLSLSPASNETIDPNFSPHILEAYGDQ